LDEPGVAGIDDEFAVSIAPDDSEADHLAVHVIL
jgi:hypothetical protein